MNTIIQRSSGLRAVRQLAVVVTLGTGALFAPVTGADAADGVPVRFSQRNLSGPRLGITYVSGTDAMMQELSARGVGNTLSQFGWQFERQIVPSGGGPEFIIEAVPLIAGVEYGKVIPSVTLAMGVRFPSGYEFGLGPNVMGASGSEPLKTALVIAVGRSFDYGGVSLPVNLVLATNPKGQRASVMLGYAIQRSATVSQTP